MILPFYPLLVPNELYKIGGRLVRWHCTIMKRTANEYVKLVDHDADPELMSARRRYLEAVHISGTPILRFYAPTQRSLDRVCLYLEDRFYTYRPITKYIGGLMQYQDKDCIATIKEVTDMYFLYRPLLER